MAFSSPGWRIVPSLFRKTECIKHPITGVHTCMKPLVAETVKNLPECRRARFCPWVGKIPWRRGLLFSITVLFSHSRILAWRILWTEEPGGFESMALLRAGHEWETSTFTFTCVKLKNTACNSRLPQQTFHSRIWPHSASLSSVCSRWKLGCGHHCYSCHHCRKHCGEHRPLRASCVPAATLLSI